MSRYMKINLLRWTFIGKKNWNYYLSLNKNKSTAIPNCSGTEIRAICSRITEPRPRATMHAHFAYRAELRTVTCARDSCAPCICDGITRARMWESHVLAVLHLMWMRVRKFISRNWDVESGVRRRKKCIINTFSEE